MNVQSHTRKSQKTTLLVNNIVSQHQAEDIRGLERLSVFDEY